MERTRTTEDHLVSLWELLEGESIIAHKLACSCDWHIFFCQFLRRVPCEIDWYEVHLTWRSLNWTCTSSSQSTRTALIWRENILKSVGMFITDNYRKGSRYHIQVSYWMSSTENGARTSRNTTLSLIEQPSKWPALTALEGSIFLSWDIILHGSVREGVKKKSSFFRKKS